MGTPSERARTGSLLYASGSAQSVDSRVKAEILDDLRQARRAGESSAACLIAACVDVLGVTGAGIMVMVDGAHRGTVGGSDDAIRLVEDLQFTLGVGPCIDTCSTGLPVLEPDLANPAVSRWPGFSEPVVDAGVAAIFGFPVQIGGRGLGALDIYCYAVGDLRPEQHADALIMADMIANEILGWQAEAEPGTLASELDQPEPLRFVVHQASGMLSVQLDLTVDDALASLRAYAYAEERPIGDVAADIVHRRLVID